MYTIKDKCYPCCTSITMGIIGGKWKTVILFYLTEEPLRYSDLKEKMPTITERTLSLQLKKLEEDGIIRRTVYNNKPPLKIQYSLTEFGTTLIPLLKAIASWGEIAAHHYHNKSSQL